MSRLPSPMARRFCPSCCSWLSDGSVLLLMGPYLSVRARVAPPGLGRLGFQGVEPCRGEGDAGGQHVHQGYGVLQDGSVNLSGRAA